MNDDGVRLLLLPIFIALIMWAGLEAAVRIKHINAQVGAARIEQLDKQNRQSDKEFVESDKRRHHWPWQTPKSR